MPRLFYLTKTIKPCAQYFDIIWRDVQKLKEYFGGEGYMPSGCDGYVSSSSFKVEDVAPKSLITSCQWRGDSSRPVWTFTSFCIYFRIA